MRIHDMKDPFEVLQMKEQELLRIRKEVDALRLTVRLLGEERPAPEPKIDLRQVVEMP
jgi:hypothetical protein